MKFRLLLLSLFTGLTATAQVKVNRCSTVEHTEYLKKKNPAYAKALDKAEGKMQSYIMNQQNSTAQRSAVVITIPVVVHVVYKTAIQNISDAQILSQIEVLNEDFRRQNADTANTPSYFQPVAADVEFEFCLAQTDPNGNATTGIERTLTTVNSFVDDDLVKSFATGGADAWDVSQYFNIWVCNLGGGLLGYAEFPTAVQSNTYGVVIGYSNFGRTGTVFTPYDLGRTATHEIGHCFNLRHIWGDDGSACTGSDLVADTPNQADENYSCPGITISCSNGPNGDMWQNYMDYTDDGCMNMFTQGQATRMQAALNSFYPTLATSQACTPLVLLQNDAGISDVTEPSGNICVTSIAPVVTLKNYGSAALTSVTINYQVDAGTVNTYSWTGNLASLATATVTLPSIAVSIGNHTLTVSTSSPNGVVDGNLTNDSDNSSFSVGTTGAALPLVDGIEAVTWPAPNFTLDNPDASTTWERTNTAHHTGSYSMYMDNFDYNASGEIDELISNPVDLSSVTNPGISFWLAYQLYTNPTSVPAYSDTLEVLISTDCGATFTSIYKKYNVALTTVTPVFSTTEFIPTASQWRNELISLAPYSSSTNAIIKFRSITDYENNLYVDDININSVQSVKQLSATSISIYPNPAKDEVRIQSNDEAVLSIYNAVGQKLTEVKVEKGINTTLSLKGYPDGVYTVIAKNENSQYSQKLVVSH